MKNQQVFEIPATWEAMLPGEHPFGEDVSFSSDFDALKSEVEKDGSLHAQEGTDWGVVLERAGHILATRSKDLWALVYAIYALYRTQGTAACPPAFEVLTRLLTAHWDCLYPLPNRPARRLAPLQWLAARMTHAAETTGFMGESPEAIAALRDECRRLQRLLDEKAGDAAPSFAGVSGTNMLDSGVEPEAPKAETPGVSPPLIPPPSVMSVAVAEVDGRVPPAALPQLVRNVMEQSRQLAGHFLSLNIQDERAYLLHRAALWGTLLQLPPMDASGVTSIACGVPKEKIQAYAAAVDGKQYAEILPQLERSAGNAPYWLDGHHLVSRCLEGLGAGPALACVKNALARLLERFPELGNCKFKDGTPFASAKTFSWLETLRSSGSDAPKPLSPAGRDEEPAGKAEMLLREAVRLHAEQGFRVGLRHLGGVPSGRSRAAVVHGLLQAEYCLAVGKKSAAGNLLQALYARLEDWGLLDWEPELSARIVTLLLSARPGLRNEAEEMIQRLHWLDLPAALEAVHER